MVKFKTDEFLKESRQIMNHIKKATLTMLLLTTANILYTKGEPLDLLNQDPNNSFDRSQQEILRKEQQHTVDKIQQTPYEELTPEAKIGRDHANEYLKIRAQTLAERAAREKTEQQQGTQDATSQPKKPWFSFKNPFKREVEPVRHDTTRPKFADETVPKSRIEEIKKIQPNDIPNSRVINFSAKELKHLTDEQTYALTGDQLLSMQYDNKIQFLQISQLNPTALAKLCQNKGKLGKAISNASVGKSWTNEMVDQLTNQQIEAILNNSNKNIHTYFSLIQLAKMHIKIKTIQNALATIKDVISQQIIQNFNYDRNRAGAMRTARALVKTKAERRLNAQEEQEFQNAMNKLTTKEKEEVANLWLAQRKAFYSNTIPELSNNIIALSREISKLDNKKNTLSITDQLELSEKEGEVVALQRKISTAYEPLFKECTKFVHDIQATLKPNEYMIELRSNQNPNHITFEIINMNKINPKISIADQYQELVKNKDISRHRLPDNKIGQMTEQAVLDAYTTWITSKMTFNPKSPTPITEQLNAHMERLTNTPFDKCNQSIQEAIIARLPKEIQDKYFLEQNVHNATVNQQENHTDRPNIIADDI